jgi:penicillin-insensitive murein DD-endopeptidase
MKRFFLVKIGASIFLMGCIAQTEQTSYKQSDLIDTLVLSDKKSAMEQYFDLHVHNGEQSISRGSVSQGTIKNAKIMPYSGNNFRYFDSASYVNGRGFSNKKVVDAVIQSYETMAVLSPTRNFCIMECSNENGGKLQPHRTHQNGLSVDFMIPVVKNRKPFEELDKTGAEHYWLTFDKNGVFIEDTTISIDFELVAMHILALKEAAQKNGIRISKILIHTDLKNNLFLGPNGQKLKTSGVYFAQKLDPIINALHDDHYHVDFEIID